LLIESQLQNENVKRKRIFYSKNIPFNFQCIEGLQRSIPIIFTLLKILILKLTKGQSSQKGCTVEDKNKFRDVAVMHQNSKLLNTENLVLNH